MKLARMRILAVTSSPVAASRMETMPQVREIKVMLLGMRYRY
jgi:hypothetical protein